MKIIYSAADAEMKPGEASMWQDEDASSAFLMLNKIDDINPKLRSLGGSFTCWW